MAVKDSKALSKSNIADHLSKSTGTTKRVATQFLDDLTALPIALEQFPTGVVFDRIQKLSRAHNLTPYDAAYLDLALDSGLPLATLDEDLAKACKRARGLLVYSA
jgi:predicted nucleic acid-binding protein